MKQWFRLTLVCCVLLCLFLSLPQAVGLNHGLQIVGLRPEFDPGKEPYLRRTVSVVRSMRFGPARTGSLAPLVLECAWTARAILVHPVRRPMGRQNRSVSGELPVKQSTSNSN